MVEQVRGCTFGGVLKRLESLHETAQTVAHAQRSIGVSLCDFDGLGADKRHVSLVGRGVGERMCGRRT